MWVVGMRSGGNSIKALHESVVGGHSRQRACSQRVKSMFYWPEMKQDDI